MIGLGRIILAAYHGTCDRCAGPVRKGEAIGYVRSAPAGNRVTCTRCLRA